jgi:hypothetical protein
MSDWRKSTYSDGAGGNCVEVGNGAWRKSSYSGDNGGDCVETASDNGVILVRDTTNREAGTLAFSVQAWQEFTRRLR